MNIKNKIQRILNKLVRRSYWYNNIVFSDCRKFWQHGVFDMDVVNLGSSSALIAFDYSDYPNLRAANWAMAPQTLVADYEILRNYSCFLRKGATVIIPLCPFSCLGGSNDDLSDKYYTILSMTSMPNASFRRQQQQMQLKNNPWRHFPLSQLLPRVRRHCLTTGDFDLDAEIRMERWRKEFSIIRFSDSMTLINKDAYHDGTKLIGKIVNYCVEREFRPVLVMPPVSIALRKHFTSEMKQQFIYDFVKEGVGEKALFLDYFADERFGDDDFKNSFMLNADGARKFTRITLKEIGIEG